MIFWDRIKYIEDNHYFNKENCPFCETSNEQKKYLIHETKYWKIVYNKFPYYWNKKHIMAIPKRHIKYTVELNNEELIDYKNIEIYMKEYYKLSNNYYSFIRQTTGWRSIEHLHYHYLPWHISFDEKSKENIFRIKNK